MHLCYLKWIYLVYSKRRDMARITTSAAIRRDSVHATSSLVAKISDLGTSSLNCQPPSWPTGVPGTLVHIAPVVFGPWSHYGPRVDIFSLGHLTLFSIAQVSKSSCPTGLVLASSSFVMLGVCLSHAYKSSWWIISSPVLAKFFPSHTLFGRTKVKAISSCKSRVAAINLSTPSTWLYTQK